MFESITKHNSVEDMVSEAMEVGRPAADHRAWGFIFEDTCKFIKSQFDAGRDWVELDWRFLSGRAVGLFDFHKDGTLYGCYHFI